jgi:protein-L-isoaspartate O-methyltransferase
MLVGIGKRRVGDVLLRELREEFCDASRAVRLWADATAPRARGRNFLSCITKCSARDILLGKRR